MARLLAYRWLYLVAALVLLLDQASKIYIAYFSGLRLFDPTSAWVIIPGVFRIVYSVNDGAAWGMFSGLGWLLVGLALVALVGIYCFRHSLELKQTGQQVLFGLIIGGILGNTIDRLAYGHVIDFLDVDLQFYQWPTFNIADSAIVVGISCYLLASFRQPTQAAR